MAENGTVAYVAVIPNCDICKMNGEADVPAGFDGRTKSGPWANMCPTHFALHGVGTGLGRGQRLVLESERPPVMIKFTTAPCARCGETTEVPLSRRHFKRIAEGDAIDVVLQDYNPAFRALVSTGIHEYCPEDHPVDDYAKREARA